MRIANSIVNRLGPTFVQSCMDATGADCATVVRSFLVVREAFGLRDLWDSLEGLDGKVSAAAQLQAMLEIRETTSRAIMWFLTRLGRTPKISTDIPTFRREIEKLRSSIKMILSPGLTQLVEDRYIVARDGGLPEDVARNLSILPVFDSAFDIIGAAIGQKADIVPKANAYFETGEYFSIDWLRQEAEAIPAHDRWSQESRNGLIDSLYRAQTGLAVRILRDLKKGETVKTWVNAHSTESDHIISLLEAMRLSGSLDLPKLMIAVQRLQQLAGV